MLSDALGAAYGIWNEIKSSIEKEYDGIVEEWKYYGATIGWTLKLLLKKRNLFFFSAHDGSFALAFVFGDKAEKEVEKSNLPERIKSELRNARKYAEGRGIRIEVKKRSQIPLIMKLVSIKVNN